MDVSRLNAVMDVLRRQLSETERRSGPNANPTPSSSPGTTGTLSRPSLIQLRQRIRDRIKSIHPADPQLASRSRRIFVESVLAWEFGDQLFADRQFDDLVEQIQTAMSSQPELDQQLAELLSLPPDDAA